MHQLIEHIVAEQNTESLTTADCSYMKLFSSLGFKKPGNGGQGTPAGIGPGQFHKAEKGPAALVDVHVHEDQQWKAFYIMSPRPV